MNIKLKKDLWHSEVEDLSYLLADKPQSEVLEILETYDISETPALPESEFPWWRRLLLVIALPLLVALVALHWFFTGSPYLNNTMKNRPWFDKMINFIIME